MGLRWLRLVRGVAKTTLCNTARAMIPAQVHDTLLVSCRSVSTTAAPSPPISSFIPGVEMTQKQHRHQDVLNALESIMPIGKSLPVNVLAADLTSENETILDSLPSGGLLGLMQSHPRLFRVEMATATRRWMSVRIRNVAVADVPTPPPLREKHPLKGPTPVAEFWTSFDGAVLLPWIPACQFAPYRHISATFPNEVTHSMPREFRSKNITRVMQAFCDVAIHPELAYRVKKEVAETHPRADPIGAELRLHETLFDSRLAMEIARHVPMAGVFVEEMTSIIPPHLVEEVQEGRKTPWKSLAAAFPTLFCWYVVGGKRKIASFIGATVEPEPCDPQPLPFNYDAALLITRDGVASALQHFIAAIPQEQVSCGVTVEYLALWLERRALLHRIETTYGGVAMVLKAHSDVLSLTAAGLVVAPSRQKSEPPRGGGGGLVAPSPPVSFLGVNPEFIPATAAEVEEYCRIPKTRWQTKIKETKKAREMFKDSPFANGPGVVAAHIHSLCPTSEWVPLSDIVAKMSDEVKAWLPRGKSLLQFMDTYPKFFDLVETLDARATSYSVRGKTENDAPTPNIVAGRYTKEEICAFIDNAIIHERGSTLDNLWSKIPLSLRKQFNSSSLQLLTFLNSSGDMYVTDGSTVRISRETKKGTEEGEKK